MKSYDIVGYQYMADIYCPSCALKDFPNGLDDGTAVDGEGNPVTPVFVDQEHEFQPEGLHCGSHDCDAVLFEGQTVTVEEARQEGYDAGVNAGMWIIEGNTDIKTAQYVLQGYEDGDPRVRYQTERGTTTMTSEWKDRIIGGLLASTLVLGYFGWVAPRVVPTYNDAPTCWHENVKVGHDMQVMVYCGDAKLSDNQRFSGWVQVEPRNGEVGQR